jgi:hypothetical protein
MNEKESKEYLQELMEYAGTDRQKSVVKAMISEGSQRLAAEKLGLHRTTVQDCLRQVKRRAARQGLSREHDMTQTVPDGYSIKGTSTLYDDDGSVKMQWVKSQQDRSNELEMATQIYSEMAKNVKRLPAMKAPTKCKDELLNLYPITDAHIGMYAWADEGGRNWDLKIAEEVIGDVFRRMIAQSEKAKSCVIAQLGDFLHFDGLLPVTPASGHVLDSDGRLPKVISVAVRVLRAVVDEALRHHELVTVIIAEGNHDPCGSVWLRTLLAALYENEPRLTVDDSVKPYYCVQHGKVMLGFHHGHLARTKQLPGIFAATEAKMWGDSEYRYGHSGHKHCTEVTADEAGGMKVTQHPTLAARDAYASRHGWVSDSVATSTTYHADYGEWSSVTVRPSI